MIGPYFCARYYPFTSIWRRPLYASQINVYIFVNLQYDSTEWDQKTKREVRNHKKQRSSIRESKIWFFSIVMKKHWVIPRPNITMTVNGAYAAVNHKVTLVNGPYFTRLASTVLRPFVDVSYTIKNGEKRAENRVLDRLRHDEIRP
jgi:hypothetical protein